MHVAHFSVQTSQKHFHRGHFKPHDYPLPIALPSLESSPSLHHVQDIWSRLVLGGLSFLICHILILCIVLYSPFASGLVFLRVLFKNSLLLDNSRNCLIFFDSDSSWIVAVGLSLSAAECFFSQRRLVSILLLPK